MTVPAQSLDQDPSCQRWPSPGGRGGGTAPVTSLAAARIARERRAGVTPLPAPAAVARAVAMALLEVEAGCRSAGQLERVCDPGLWATLEPRLRTRHSPLPTIGSLLKVVCQQPLPGRAETVAVLRRGERVRPVAMRLDARNGRWTVTALSY